jgi:CheY-like chemotaxis protein
VSRPVPKPRKEPRPRGSASIMLRARALILCVERDPHMRELEAYFLDQAGFVVHFAEDGERALELARSLKPAVVITEILVPKLDGLALCPARRPHHNPRRSGPGWRSLRGRRHRRGYCR